MIQDEINKYLLSNKNVKNLEPRNELLLSKELKPTDKKIDLNKQWDAKRSFKSIQMVFDRGNPSIDEYLLNCRLKVKIN